jgi:hypothetical protein
MSRVQHATIAILLFGMNLGLHNACTGEPPTPAGLRGGDASSRVDAALEASPILDGGARDAAEAPDAGGERPDAGDITRMAIEQLESEFCAWRARCSGATGSCSFDPFDNAEEEFITLASFDPEKISALATCFHDLDRCDDAEDATARCVGLTTLNQRLVSDCFDKESCTNTSWGLDWCVVAPLLDDELESNLSRCASLPDCASAQACLADMGIVE